MHRGFPVGNQFNSVAGLVKQALSWPQLSTQQNKPMLQKFETKAAPNDPVTQSPGLAVDKQAATGCKGTDEVRSQARFLTPKV